MDINSWGYAIDYDKAIAEDEKAIAMYERIIAGRWFLPAGQSSCFLWELALLDETIAAGLDLSRADLANLAAYMEANLPIADESGRDWYSRGEEIDQRLQELCPDMLLTEEKAREALKFHKTRLARHKRNKAKFGGGS